MAYHVFISYRRQGASELALLLYKQLSDDGYSPFLDVKGMNSGHFDNQIYDRIAECSDMLVLLPPDAFAHGKGAEDWFYNEISYALRAGKNVIPVMLPGFQWPQTMLPFMDELRYCQGVEVSTQYFDAMYAKIRELISYKPSSSPKTAVAFPRGLLAALVICVVLAAGAAGMLLGASGRDKTPPSATATPTPRVTSTPRPTATPTPRLTATPTPKPTATPTPASFDLGDSVKFGRYGDDIYWTVLESDAYSTKLISKECVACMPFGESTSWSSSSLRKWLNKEFLDVAFVGSDRNAMIQMGSDWIRIPSEKDMTNPQYGFSANPDAKDVSRAAAPSQTAIEQNVAVMDNGRCSYYLMTPNIYAKTEMKQIRSDGRFGVAGISRNNVGIRIIITVETSALRR